MYFKYEFNKYRHICTKISIVQLKFVTKTIYSFLDVYISNHLNPLQIFTTIHPQFLHICNFLSIPFWLCVLFFISNRRVLQCSFHTIAIWLHMISVGERSWLFDKKCTTRNFIYLKHIVFCWYGTLRNKGKVKLPNYISYSSTGFTMCEISLSCYVI